jgi:two-component system sensor histidine kinase/response regulator
MSAQAERTEDMQGSALRRVIRGHMIALGAVGTGYAIKLMLDPLVPQQDSPYLVFPVAVMVSAWYSGWRAGILATVLSAILSHRFSDPGSTALATWMRTLLFLTEGGVISALAESLRRSRRFIDQQSREVDVAKKAATELDLNVQSLRDELSTQESMLRHLVNSNVLGYLSCELNGRILEANDALLTMVEASRSDLESGQLNWMTLTPAEFRDQDNRLIEKLRATGRFEAAEKEYIAKSGRRVPIWIAVAFTPDRQAVMCFILDQTLQKQTESALIQAKEAAEQSNRTRADFVANVSHELRTPMNAILGMTELALDEDLPAQARDYLETSFEASRTLLSLLDDVLDFSRIDADKLELEAAPFSVRMIVDQVMRIMGLRASEKGLELTGSVSRNVPDRVIGDQGRFRQILLNLVGNAVKFTSHGEILVEVSVSSAGEALAPGRADAVHIQAVVKDTGIGISPEDQAMIFEPFTQVDSSSTREIGGTGLGLSIVRQLARAMHGDVNVTSESGRGSQFTVDLAFPVADGASEAGISENPLQQRLQGARILVIDDNQTNLRVLWEMISSWSMTASLAGSAEEALQILRAAAKTSTPFSYVLVDYAMPSTDGVRLIREAREQGLLPGTAILMVSSRDRKLLGKESSALPVQRFLRKPVSQSELLELLIESADGPQLETPSLESLSDIRLGLRILVVEDARANQEVVKAILEKRGHQVTLVGNGREAVELVQSREFDVVLMDVQMPEMDGLSATRIIRQLPTHSHVPIIAMTAHAMRGDREKCLTAGMNDYISKPIDSHQLIRRVEQGFGKKSRRPSDSTDVDLPKVQNTHDSTDTAMSDRMIDVSGSLERMGGDVHLLKEMATYFIQDSPLLLQTILRERSGEEATRAAHSLRGLASNFGAELIMESAMRIESTATSEEGRNRAISQLEEDLPRLLSALQKLVDAEQV